MSAVITKRFTSKIPITREGVMRFPNFDDLNTAIEEYWHTKEDILDAYNRVMLWEESWFWTANTLDTEIDKLVNGAKVTVNKIHEFANYKFDTVDSIVRDKVAKGGIFGYSIPWMLDMVIYAISSLTPQKFYGSINTWRTWDDERFNTEFEISEGESIPEVLENFDIFLNALRREERKVFEEHGEAYPIIIDQHWYDQRNPPKKAKKPWRLW